MNLGSNAIKYNVHGGNVVFSATLNPEGRVTLMVEDSGIGMSPEQLAHLYEPFNRLGRESLKVGFSGLAWPGPERPPIPAWPTLAAARC